MPRTDVNEPVFVDFHSAADTNVRALNQAADASPETVRVSVDCKATVAVGDYSRDGQARGSEAVKASDHDMDCQTKLTPCGLLQPKAGELMVAFGQSAKTSDFVADVIADWARRKQPSLPQVKELLINLDNGPENSGRRTQFLQRMVDLADETGWRIHLVYYPPYHSKYNPVERCWGVLERSPSVQRADGIGLVLQHDLERTQAIGLAVRASLCQGRPVGKGGQASFRTEAQTLRDSPQMGRAHRTQGRWYANFFRLP